MNQWEITHEQVLKDNYFDIKCIEKLIIFEKEINSKNKVLSEWCKKEINNPRWRAEQCSNGFPIGMKTLVLLKK